MQTIKAWLKKRNVLIFLAQIGIYFMLTATWCVVVYITERNPWVATASVAHQRCYVLSAPRWSLWQTSMCLFRISTKIKVSCADGCFGW